MTTPVQDQTHLSDERLLELVSDLEEQHQVSPEEDEHLGDCSQCCMRLVQLARSFYEVMNPELSRKAEKPICRKPFPDSDVSH